MRTISAALQTHLDLEVTTLAMCWKIERRDGVVAAFQVAKVYTQGAYNRSRKITKPSNGTLLVAVAGSAKAEGTHYNASYTTGIITFTGGNIPTAGQAVTAGFEFDVPVRFDTDRLSINIDDYNAGAAQVPLIELKSGDT